MGIEPTGEKPLTTVDGKFYVGMKSDELETDKEKRKFKKIDKSGDGKLSGAEIVAKRRQELSRQKLICTLSTGLIGKLLGAGNETYFKEKFITDNYEEQHKFDENYY